MIGDQAKMIDDAMKQQEKDLVKVKECINQIDAKTEKLETKIN